MSQVAREAKLAKGTLYLYFDTKEELFLALLGEHLRAWFGSCGELLGEAQPRTADELADVLIASVRGRASLLRLLPLNTVLQRQVRPGGEQRLRREIRRGLCDLLARLPLAPELGLRVFSHLYAVAIGWQQIAEARAGWTELETEPGSIFVPPAFQEGFGPALRAVLRELLGEGLGEGRAEGEAPTALSRKDGRPAAADA